MQAFVEAGIVADGAIVCEPTSLTVMPAHKGFLWVEAMFRGKAAHGSRPDEGIDAILHAGRFLARLEELQARLASGPLHPLLQQPSFHAGTIRGGSAPSVYPHECELVLERRTLPAEEREDVFGEFLEVIEELRREIPTLNVDLRPGLFRPGTEVAEDSRLVQTLLNSLEEEGLPRSVQGMSAWVDAAFLNEAGIPAVCFGPGSIAKAHSSEEWVPISELEVGARVLSRFVDAFLSE
jgi:acetylornithine deacetylase